MTTQAQLNRSGYWRLFGTGLMLTLVLLGVLMSTVLQYPAFRWHPAYLDLGKTLVLLVAAGGLFGTTLATTTATLRRLHDRQLTGRLLWWLVCPVIGWGIVGSQLVLPSRGPRQPVTLRSSWRHPRPWTALFGGTLLYAIACNFVGIAALNGATSATSPATATAPVTPTAANQLVLGRHHISLTTQRTYRVAYRDSRWAHTTFVIDRITVYHTYGPYRIPSNDGPLTINGIIQVHMRIHAGANIQTYPAAKTLTTNDGQHLIADRSNSDVFAGDLNQGTWTAGNIYYLMPRLNEVADVTRINLTWDAATRAQPRVVKAFQADIALDHKK
ncbi:DUF805 domain-containing protein [Levilactobacillus sp.]|uniref:DUF805 domain-containing protein n=1 Tax=Levilactobacillus sp. TaxID=2767919 RepID=UPI00339026E8|nr:hypothetical protein [Levilactobacillus sp.]MCI1605431.1 hypothetical protein [Levilactobacillus sp.]